MLSSSNLDLGFITIIWFKKTVFGKLARLLRFTMRSHRKRLGIMPDTQEEKKLKTLIVKEPANDGEKQMFYCLINEENLEKCPGWENRHKCYALPHQDLCVLLQAEFDGATKTFDVIRARLHKQIINDAVIED